MQFYFKKLKPVNANQIVNKGRVHIKLDSYPLGKRSFVSRISPGVNHLSMSRPLCGSFSVVHLMSICLHSNNFVHIWHQNHFKVKISLALVFKLMIVYIFGVKCIFTLQFPEHLPSKYEFCTYLVSNTFSSDNFLSICLQSNDFVHIWSHMHFKVTIS